MITTQTTMMMIAIIVMSVELDEVPAGGEAGEITMIDVGMGVSSVGLDGVLVPTGGVVFGEYGLEAG